MSHQFGLAPSELPILPPLRARALAALLNPDAGIHDFLSVIEGDPALTASVLRASNSAWSAPRYPIHSARDAIVRIGLDAARQITSAAIMHSQFEHLDESGLNVDAFWRRQLAVGVLVEGFALQARRPQAEIRSAFTVGLLHQMGRLALAARSPERYRTVVERARKGEDPLVAELQAFEIDAVQLTKNVATRWSLPEAIAGPLAAMDDPDAAGLPPLMREAIEVAELIGFDQGFSSEVVAPLSLPADHPRADALLAIGGEDELRQRVDWFRSSTGAHRTPPPQAAEIRPLQSQPSNSQAPLDQQAA